MTFDLLMQQRMDRFIEILKILPATQEIPGELLILSAGDKTGSWSYRHVVMKGETIYFIFRKEGYADGKLPGWECVDRELNEVMKERIFTTSGHLHEKIV